MAQEKLLHVLMIIAIWLGGSTEAVAGSSMLPEIEFSQEDKDWAKELSTEVMNMTLDSIKAKYVELMQMTNQAEGGDGGVRHSLAEYDIFSSGPVIKIFVSSSMSDALLKEYAMEARKYNATLVLNGLPNDSWQELSRLVAAVNEGAEELAMQIDDQAFIEYEITAVPTIVLAKQQDCFALQTCRHVFDKVVGNLDIKAALELFAGDGDLADEARKILGK
jgi:type-F conjugative transfer system pilin assembly protein TrbC